MFYVSVFVFIYLFCKTYVLCLSSYLCIDILLWTFISVYVNHFVTNPAALLKNKINHWFVGSLVGRSVDWRTGGYCWSSLLPLCPCWLQLVHWIREKMPDFSSLVLPTQSRVQLSRNQRLLRLLLTVLLPLWNIWLCLHEQWLIALMWCVHFRWKKSEVVSYNNVSWMSSIITVVRQTTRTYCEISDKHTSVCYNIVVIHI